VKVFVFYFYKFSRLLVKLICNVFYPNTIIRNQEPLRSDEPMIIVSNHPNTLLDAVGTAARAKKMVFFLGNIGMFSTKFTNWFFTNFYVIPIERPKDVQGRKIQNNKSFEKCDIHLTNKGRLYIAPQGVSQDKRRLDTIKTGTARIALSAESKNDFNLGLNIVPVGLNYSSPRHYGSSLFMNVGDPIPVSDFKENYENDAFATARKLTDHLAEKMKELIIDTIDEEEDALIRKVETIQQTDQPLPIDTGFDRSKKTIEQLRQLKKEQPQSYQTLADNLRTYFATTEKIQATDKTIISTATNPSIANRFGKFFLLLLGVPFFLYGWLNNLLAYSIPLLVMRKLNIYKGYDSAIKTVIGLVTFPLFYCLQTWFVHSLFNHPILTVLYALSLYPLGRFAWWYKNQVKKYTMFGRVKKYFQQNKAEAAELLENRNAIVNQLANLSTTVAFKST